MTPEPRKKKHTASFLVSNFLLSKRSLKPIYKLCPISICVLRYVADCIDLNFNKRKKAEAKLSYGQIATYVRTSEASVKRALQHLKKKRLLQFKKKSGIFRLGIIVLGQVTQTRRTDIGRVTQTFRKEAGHTDPTVRSGSHRPLSNSSNFTNTREKKNQNEKRTLEEQAEIEKQALLAKEKLRSMFSKHLINRR